VGAVQERGVQDTKAWAQRAIADVDKLRTDMKFELERSSGATKLDLNLEKSLMRDQLAKHAEERAAENKKMNDDINAVRMAGESNKSEMIKYMMATVAAIVGTVATVGIGVMRVVDMANK